MNKDLDQYVLLVDFIADIMGDQSEVVLHEVYQDGTSSVVAIRNGYVSGRTLGSPMTEIGVKLLKEAKEADLNYLTGKIGYSKSGNKTNSSTWIIRDAAHEIIGMLCVNSDYSELTQMQTLLNSYIGKLHLHETVDTEKRNDSFNMSVTELVDHNLQVILPGFPDEAPKLSQREKVDIVSKLYDLGTFYMKGAVAVVAERIGSSIPTVYRYLNTLKKNVK